MFLTKYNIEHEFQMINKSMTQTIKRSKYYPSYTIIKKNINIKNNSYVVFKIIKENKIYYYASEKNKYIGEGYNGVVYDGYNVLTNELIVVKYGYIGNYEVTCLIITDMYICHMNDIVIMRKAPGISYDKILMNKSISDGKKIVLHKKIINNLINLGLKYNILHCDPKPEHIFIHDDKITFIDFGLSELKSSINSDIEDFNKHTLMYIKKNSLLKRFIMSVEPYYKIPRFDSSIIYSTPSLILLLLFSFFVL